MWLDLVFEFVDLVVHSGSWRYTLACQMCLHRGLFRRTSRQLSSVDDPVGCMGGGLRPLRRMGGGAALLCVQRTQRGGCWLRMHGCDRGCRYFFCCGCVCVWLVAVAVVVGVVVAVVVAATLVA